MLHFVAWPQATSYCATSYHDTVKPETFKGSVSLLIVRFDVANMVKKKGPHISQLAPCHDAEIIHSVLYANIKRYVEL